MIEDDLGLDAIGRLAEKRRKQREDLKLQNRLKDNSQNLAKGSLDAEVHRVKGKIDVPNMNEEVARIKGSTKHLGSSDKLSQISGDSFRDKIERLRKNKTVDAIGDGMDSVLDLAKSKKGILKKIASSGLKSIPLLGGAISLMGSSDASAAIPILDQAEPTGPEQGSIDQRLEQDTLTEEDKAELKRRQEEIFGKHR